MTILELILVLATVGLLASVGIPRMDRAPAAAVEQAARVVAADLRMTRIRAIAGGRRARTILLLDEGRMELRVETDDDWQTLGTRHLPEGVRFDPSRSTRITDGRVTITFHPHGLTADNATIALAGTDAVRRVVVNQAGRVRVE